MTEAELAALRARNRKAAFEQGNFEHPGYPEPFANFPYSRYEASKPFYTGSCPVSQHDELWWASPTDEPGGIDPYSALNRSLADQAIEQYRAQVAYPAWSNRIGEYPVPDYLNEKAKLIVPGDWCSFSRLEVTTGLLIEWLFDLVMEPHDLRCYVTPHVRAGKDPREPVIWIFKRTLKSGEPLGNPGAFFLRQAEKIEPGGTLPKSPRGPAPVTKVQRPDLSQALPGWTPSRPAFDSSSFEEATQFYRAAQEGRANGGWISLFEELGVEIPRMSAEDWLYTVQHTLDPVRAKVKAAKSMRR